MTSIPQKFETLPKKSGNHTKKNPEFCLLQEASLLFFKFFVRSYIRTFISFQMYYRIPPPRIYIFIGAVESWVRVGLPKSRNSYQKIQKILPKKIQEILPKNPENVARKIQKTSPKKSRKCCQKNPENIAPKIQKKITTKIQKK